MNQEAQNKILEGALNLFINRGIKALTMDDLAEHLGMSKRTIYENFADKKTIVLESIKLFNLKYEKLADEVFSQGGNTIEKILKNIELTERAIKSINKVFFEDLKHYPMVEEYFKSQTSKMGEGAKRIIEQGKKEQVIRESANTELVAALVTQGSRKQVESLIENGLNLDPFTIKRELSWLVLRGIVTEKGMILLDEFEKKNKTV